MPILAAWFAALTALTVGVSTVTATQPKSAKANVQDVATVAGKIDDMLGKRWAEVKAQPAPLADDAEFLRRVYLDLTGVIPSVAESRAFLKDKRADRRQLLVDRLLASQRYSYHFSNMFRTLLVPELSNDLILASQQEDFEIWLRRRLAKNTTYDRVVRDLLVAPIQQMGSVVGSSGAPNAQLFYAAKRYQVENLAAATARLFLGVSVECAQCHNHPFAEWKREQFWAFAAFFSGIRGFQGGDFLQAQPEVAMQNQLTIPGTETVVQAKFLDEKAPDWKTRKVSTRTTLADWVTAPDNPFFSRATVNRFWAYFLGTGLVEPVDDMASPGSVAIYPEILDYLATEFVKHEFDLKFLMRVLTATRAYQLTSAGAFPRPLSRGEGKGPAQENPALFIRMPVRGLTAEQLFDSVAMATGYRSGGQDAKLGIFGYGPNSARGEFLAKFSDLTTRPVDMQTSVLRALTLMNGKFIADATSLSQSETLAAIVDAPFLTTASRIETLYLATLSRIPSSKELSRATRFVDEAIRQSVAEGADAQAQRRAASDALGDIFWALLNSPEFTLNH